MSITVTTATIGEAWLEIASRILETGRESRYDDLPIRELAHATLEVSAPNPHDLIIERLADPQRLAWMRTNFVDHSRVEALGGARSYASRLLDYAESGTDQVAWVIERLRADPTSRSATITTFEPLLDTSYIPCVSMLDFWVPEGAVDLVVYAHSIDFGAKGYGNLVQLAEIQSRVGTELGLPVGTLTFIVKSAHVYATEFEFMRGVLTSA
ncbi:hypothetical protein BH10ACT7_BH10ACT7_01800 [soil metagenome]